MNLQELEKQLATMQEEIARLKKEEAKPKLPAIEEDAFQKVLDEMRSIFIEAVTGKDLILASTVIGMCSDENGKINCGQATLTSTQIQDFHEETLATAMDVFSNPRRITIIKHLISGSLSASEISQRTGLIGGQLYHHLSILENAKLIHKSAEKYSAPPSTQTMLSGLFALAGGMEFAREGGASDGLSA